MHLSDRLTSALQKRQKLAFSGSVEALESCPTEGGIYILLLQLAAPIAISRPKAAMLEAGLYAYIGSAYGPGGLRARLGRHLRAEKKQRWHIDKISTVASERYAYGWSTGKECDLRRLLQRASKVSYPLPGFGSSDCRACPSHLLRIEA